MGYPKIQGIFYELRRSMTLSIRLTSCENYSLCMKWLARFYICRSWCAAIIPFYLPCDIKLKNKKVRCCLSFVPRAQLLKKSAWLLHLIGDKAPPTALDSSEVARTVNRRCYPHIGNDGHNWCLSSSLSLSIGFSIQDETMDVARSAPQGSHYHADVIYLPP